MAFDMFQFMHGMKWSMNGFALRRSGWVRKSGNKHWTINNNGLGEERHWENLGLQSGERREGNAQYSGNIQYLAFRFCFASTI